MDKLRSRSTVAVVEKKKRKKKKGKKGKHTFPIRPLLPRLIQGQRVDRAAAARVGQDGLVGHTQLLSDAVNVAGKKNVDVSFFL